MLLLAEHTTGSPNLGWYLGLGIGFAIVVVVVIVVAAILALASRIGEQAKDGTGGLDAARVSTLPLWDVEQTNRSARGILQAARAARQALPASSGTFDRGVP